MCGRDTRASRWPERRARLWRLPRCLKQKGKIPMSEANLGAMVRFFDLANAHDADSLANMHQEDFVGESDAFPEPLVGRDAYRNVLAGLWAAFPDTSYKVEQMLAAEDCVVTRLRLTGTHRGAFMGKEGTGKRFDIRLCHVDQWKDGKIKRSWYYWDTATLLRQLGISGHSASA